MTEFRSERKCLDFGSRYFLSRLVMATIEENIDRVHHMLMDDRQLTICQILNAISISCVRVENILHNEPGINKVSARWVTHLLTPDQNRTWRENLTLFSSNIFLKHRMNIVAHHFEPETNRFMLWKKTSSAQKKANVVSSVGKFVF